MRIGARIKKQEAKKALVIGVSEYDNLRPPFMKFCENDGNEMVSLLTTEPFGYEISDKLLGRVSWTDIRISINNFFLSGEVRSRDMLLFYFSGHGIMGKSSHYYLAPSDVDAADPVDTVNKGFSFDDLEDVIRGTKSNRVVIILDCCFSGALKLKGRVLRKGSQKVPQLAAEAIEKKAETVKKKSRSGKGIAILCACLGTQEAESTTKRDYSIFTQYLLKGLKGTDNEYVDKNGNVTTSLLGNYVFDKVTNHEPKSERPEQEPIIKFELSGDIVLAHYPDKIKQEVEAQSQMLLKLLQQGKISEFNKILEENPYQSRDLHGVNLAKADLKEANLKEVNFVKADLKEANLLGAYLGRANLEGANLEGANLEGANLEKAYLWKANLEGANLEKANLEKANLMEAKLQQAILKGANLRQTENLPISKEEAKKRGAIV